MICNPISLLIKVAMFQVLRVFGQALIIMFPSDFDLRHLLKLQREKKIKCVKKQLMIGATYNTVRTEPAEV